MNKIKLIALSSSLAVLGLTGCAPKKMDDDMQAKRIAELETKLSETSDQVVTLSSENQTLRSSMGTTGEVVAMSSDLYPPNAKPGEC